MLGGTDSAQIGLLIVCGVVVLINLVLFLASALALLRVLRAAARDAYSSPRRRLLALDDGGARRSPSRVAAVLGACRPWTTQKALLAMVAFTAGLRFVWVLAASQCWDATTGTVANETGPFLRAVFYGLDFFQAAAAFTLFTILARFWAELAYAARHGAGSSRAIGGGDEYRPRGTPPLIWKLTKTVQRAASAIAFAGAGIATVMQATIWSRYPTYMDTFSSLVEGGAYILAAVLIVTAAYHAVAELRLVPIELPTRRRRVCRIVAVTGSIASCLVVRSVVLIWSADKAIILDNDWNLVGVVLYLTLLDAMPLAIVLAYNRMAPLSTSSPSVDRGRGRNPGFEVRRRAPEEEPLITGTGTGRRYEAGNPFLEEHPGVHA